MRGESNAKHKLGTPTLAMLPRVSDSLSFLYLEAVRVVQDDTGVCAQIETTDGTDRVYLPTAALACILLGPGTSITQPALATIARHGTTIVCTGSGGVRCYANIMPTSLSTRWLERQAKIFSDDNLRVDAATRMYQRRFSTTMPDGMSLQQLRGLEGQRVKTLYKILAQRHKIQRFKRNYDPARWDDADPVNKALSAANTCLYGVTHAAITALGCSPALGFIHAGKQHAFIYDIADLYKAETTIPLAFSLHASTDPERDARRALREQFRLVKMLPRIVTDIQYILDPTTANAYHDSQEPSDLAVDLVHLWDPQIGRLAAGVNYGDDPFDDEFDDAGPNDETTDDDPVGDPWPQ